MRNNQRNKKRNKMKILVLDIETLPALSYHFRMWDENFGPDQFKEVSRIYSVGLKWLGEKYCSYFEAPTVKDRRTMLESVYLEMHEADAIVTYNGNKFDLRRLQGEFAEMGFLPLGRLTSIDVIDTVKTFALPSNKLAHALTHFKCGKKVKTEGMPLWVKVFNGDEKARSKMAHYCRGDVLGLEKLYKKLRPMIKNHPDLSKGLGCPVCANPKKEPLAPRYTKLYTISKCRCTKCGHVYDGKRSRVRKGT